MTRTAFEKNLLSGVEHLSWATGEIRPQAHLPLLACEFAQVTTFLLLSSVSSSVERILTIGFGIRHPPRRGRGFVRSWDPTDRVEGSGNEWLLLLLFQPLLSFRHTP